MEIAIIGAGIVGCTAAVVLAEAGADVTVFEREAIAAEASGRNSGVVQDPGDPELDRIYRDSLAWHGLDRAEPTGVLIVGQDEFDGATLSGTALQSEEPLLADGLHAALITSTGFPAPPGDATRRLAERAREAGARFAVGGGDARAVPGGVVVDADRHAADVVLVCAGAFTVAAAGVDGWSPIRPLWGVVCEVDLPTRAQRPIEEHGVDALLHPGGPPPALFSLVGDVLGSTFDDSLPDATVRTEDIRVRAQQFLPSVATAPVRSTRTCPRPQSADGRPWIGPLRDDLHVCAGHGAWGVSLGPGSGRLAAEIILGRAQAPPALAASRPPRWPPAPPRRRARH